MKNPVEVFKRNYRDRLHSLSELRYRSDINPDSVLSRLINFYSGAIINPDETISGNKLEKPDTIYTKTWYSPSPDAPNAGAWTPARKQVRGNKNSLHREFNKTSKRAKVTENEIQK